MPYTTLVELLRERAQEQGGDVAFVYLRDGEVEHARLTYAELELRARAIAARLQREGRAGERALLLYPSGLDYICAFFGCLYAGVIAVPTYPPTSQRSRTQRLDGIVQDSGASWLMGDRASLAGIDAETWPQLRRFPTDEADVADAEAWQQPPIDGSAIAFLQYTSGSTGVAKGVIVTHANLLRNEALIQRGFDTDSESVIVGWLPLYHDMGLIGNVLQPLYLGARAVLMSPMAFLQKPVRWLQAISDYRATVSGGPDFAYALCAERVAAEQRANLDLGSWRIAFNGAEPIRAQTLARFAQAFTGCGFDATSFFPCYGLAEATLFVAGADPAEPVVSLDADAAALREDRYVAAGSATAARLVSSGNADADTLRIVDPAQAIPVDEGHVGEIWLRGPSIAQGYWQREAASAETFRAYTREGEGPFLRTGDLGFVLDGRLYVTGRSKELIIVRGRNHYPQDIEQTLQASDAAFAPGNGAAFAVEMDGEERVVVVQEVQRTRLRKLDAPAAIAAAKAAVAAVHEVPLHDVLLIGPMRLPKTSSGKIQRRRARELYESGSFERIGAAAVVETGGAEVVDAAAVRSAPAAERQNKVLAYLRGVLAEALRVAPGAINAELPLAGQGMDSLSAIQLQHRVQEELQLDCALASLLGGITLSQLAADLALGPVSGSKALAPSGLQVGPLSGNQQSMWFLHGLNPHGSAHTIAVPLRIAGGLDADHAQAAWHAVSQRHPVLRTRFEDIDGEAAQRISGDGPQVEWIELAGASREEVDAAIAQPAAEPWHLHHGAIRVLCLRETGSVVMLLLAHHIAVDLWSLVLLLRDWAACYGDLAAGRALPAAASRHTGIDYALWQRDFAASEAGVRQLQFWRQRLGGELPVLHLPTDQPRPRMLSDAGAACDFVLSPELGANLRKLARELGITPYALLLSAYSLLLHKYGGDEEICIGTPAAGRGRAEFAPLVGFCANTLVIRAAFDSAARFDRFAGGIAQQVRDALAHQDFPFSLLVEALAPQREPGVTPLFQTLFTLHQPQAMPEAAPFVLGEAGARLQLNGLDLESCNLPCGGSAFDLSLLMIERDGGYAARFEYRRALFDASRITGIAERFRQLLCHIVAKPRAALGALSLHTPETTQALLRRGWGERAEWASPVSIVARVEAQAAATPDAVALVCGGDSLSYSELDARAGIFAAELRERGVCVGDRVALCLARGVDLYAGVLAVLKLGATYVPVDPGYPRQRRQLIVDLAQPRLLVRTAADDVIDNVDELVIASLREARHVPLRGSGVAHAELPIYLMYTSGSTGTPKGVLMRQGALANLLHWHASRLPLQRGEHVTQFAATGFDVSFQEIFSTWCAGATLVVVEEAQRHDPAALLSLLRAQRIVRSFLPVVVLHQLAQHALSEDVGSLALRDVICAGEQLVVNAEVRALFGRLGGAALHNHYGPTETHVVTSHVLSGDAQLWPQHPPIGTPIANAAVHLLDRDGAPVPADGIGEICLGGAVLAQGYYGRGDLTAERFVPQADGSRLYRTGDMARRDEHGCLHYLGRRDQQIQLRGFRVELAEIESALLALPGVSEAVVILHGDRLLAYVVARDVTLVDWRPVLAERLPQHMLPSHCVVLEALPLTTNGKVDKRALPVPDFAATDAAFVAPGTPTEVRVAAAWCDLLGTTEASIHANFFAGGGHSLLATRLVSRLRQEFAVELPVAALFEAPTIAGLARRIEAAPAANTPPPVRVPRDRPLPLSFAQQRLWFLDQLEGPGANYNMPAAFRLRGALDVDALRRSFAQIVARHEILRTRFVDGVDGPVQQIDTCSEFDLPLIELSPAALDVHLRAHAQGAFDLGAGGLLRAEVLRLAAQDHLLLVNMHHIVSDGWSIGVMVRELNALYAASVGNVDAKLEALPLQYADYAAWQRRWLQGAALQRQLAYWRERLAELPPLLEIPGDRPRPPVQSLRAGVHRFEFEAGLIARLNRFNRERGVTLLASLMAAFQLLLARHSGQDDIAVGTPVANRDRAETQGLIGFFVNTVVLRQRVDTGMSFAELVGQVSAAAQAAQAHQDLPFEQLVEELKPARSMSHMPLIQMMLLLHDGAAEGLRLPGIDVERVDNGHGVARFDLALNVEPQGDGLVAWFDYAADLFDAQRVARLGRHYQRLLSAALDAPERPVARLPMLDAEEAAQQVAAQWELAPAGHAVGVHALIERQADATPDAIAIVHGDRRLTYRDLEAQANRLAHALLARGVRAEDHVGVWLERSPELVIAQLAIWKSGAIYVPMDPAYPKERLDSIAADARLRCVLADSQLAKKFPVPHADCLFIDRLDQAIATRPAVRVHRLQPAYVIYTSGSTGRPKGVQVLHAGLAELLGGLRQRYAVTSDDSMLSVASQSFGIAFVELLLPLITGGHTHILAREQVLDTESLANALQRVSLAHLVPSLMRRVLDHLAGSVFPAGTLRQVFVGGDAVAPSLLADMAATFPRVAVTEFYGQTETTILSTHAPQLGAPPSGNVIGTRLDHAQVYVLDERQQLLPQGCVGEICIGGHGIARGYLGRPDQPAQRFLPHPFAQEPGARLYRTGDLGRLRSDGSVEYVGRRDFQVNIRGFRIELGEIESVLRADARVQGAIVDARESERGDKRLVAYLVAVAGQSLSVADLRARLRTSLPDYMMPAHFVVLDAFPLNANGKLDRRALPSPDPQLPAHSYVAPRDELEQGLADLWAEVLGVPRVGIEDNFFDLGGHSLLAAQAMARVRQRFGIALGVADFFEAQTVAAFAARLAAAQREAELLARLGTQPADATEEMESFTL